MKPKYLGFPYKYIALDDCSSDESLPPLVKRPKLSKSNKKAASKQLKRKPHTQEELTGIEVIEILDSSPEKSPKLPQQGERNKVKRNLCIEDSEVLVLSPEKSLEEPQQETSKRNPLKRRLSVQDSDDSNMLPDIEDFSDVSSSSSEDIIMTGCFQDFYQKDPHMPIYKRLSKGIETKEANKVLLQTHNEHSVAKNIPTHVIENISFVYSIKFIGHWKNTLCDGMGSWKETGKQVTSINISAVEFNIADDIKTVLKESEELRSVRHKYVNNTSPDLHRVVIHLETDDGTVLDRLLVQYYFDDEPHSFQPNPHKNSKSLEKYQRTNDSAKLRIRTLLSDGKKKPKDIFHTILEEQGGIENTSGGAFIPRDRQQIKKNCKTKC